VSKTSTISVRISTIRVEVFNIYMAGIVENNISDIFENNIDIADD